MKHSSLVFVFMAAIAIIVAGCSSGPEPIPQISPNSARPIGDNPSSPVDASANPQGNNESTNSPSNDGNPAEKPLSAWMTASLIDVNSGDSFSINQFKGKPVVVESFAVWCPVCLRQQQESKKLEERLGDQIIGVNLDADPNEDEAKVKEHTARHGFDWRYAVVDQDVSNSLTDDFGLSIVNVPVAPMIVVCEDQSSHRLRNGVKSAQDIQDAVTDLCGTQFT